jgi:hypothetical protein
VELIGAKGRVKNMNIKIAVFIFFKMTTKKFNSFIARPLKECTLDDVPGVGRTSLSKLLRAGIDTPEKLVGMYFISNKDPENMKRWLMYACSIRAQEAGAISEALDKKTRDAMIF